MNLSKFVIIYGILFYIAKGTLPNSNFELLVENQMQVIDNAKVDNLEIETNASLGKIVESCKLCHLTKVRRRRFLFSVKDDATCEFSVD